MTKVELWCRMIYLGLLIEQLERGPRFTRLPPAHYYHGHVNEITPPSQVGRRGVSGYGDSTVRFTVSRRKWMLDQVPEPVNVPTPLRMPELPYDYRNLTTLKRRKLTAAILKSIEEAGGDLCAKGRLVKKTNGKGYQRAPGHKDCYCLDLENHQGQHRCEHGYW